jgi:hypothetical protein
VASEHLLGVVQVGLPFGFGDTEAGVRGLHVAANVDAGTAGEGAELIDEQLAGAEVGIGAATEGEASEARIGPEEREEVINYPGDGIVPTEAPVE